MSIDTYRNRLTRKQKEKAKLNDDLAGEKSNFSKLSKDASKLESEILKARSDSIRKSKQRQLDSKRNAIAKSQKKIADIEKNIANKISDIHKLEKQIVGVETQERKRQRQEELNHLRETNKEREYQKLIDSTSYIMSYGEQKQMLSSDAKNAIQIFLQLLEDEKITKSIILWNYGAGSVRPKLVLTDRSNIELPVPFEDLEELAALGVIRLQRTQGGWKGILLPEMMRAAISDSVQPDNFTIFYSWQSWQSPKTNRHFMNDCVLRATKSIRNDNSIDIEPVVDRDTMGRSGSIDISATIFEKIAQSQIFLCDVTIVTPLDAINPSPNPNVMIELGFASAILGWEKIICVANTAFGNVEQMPFDLRSRRLLTYYLEESSSNKSEERKSLAKSIEHAIRNILENEYSSV